MSGNIFVPKGYYHLILITILYHWSLGGEAKWIMTEKVRSKWVRGQVNDLEPVLAAPLLHFLAV